LAVHETVADPDPVPFAGDTVIHEPFPAAVQVPPVHPEGAPVTVTTRDPAPASELAEVGEIENDVQVGTAVPAWVTAKLCPATVALPVRDEVDVFPVQLTVTPPGPVPLIGYTLSQDPLPLAAHEPPAQPAGAPVMVTNCVPAAAVGVTEVGVIENDVQVGGGGTPACVTPNVFPAIVAFPERDEVAVLAVHETVAVPGPFPLTGNTVIQKPFPAAVQTPPAQPAGTPAIVTTCEPAPAPGLADDGAIVKDVQVGGVGQLSKTKVFDTSLRLWPVGPSAATLDSYVPPGSGQPGSVAEKSETIVLAPSGVGLPRSIV